MNTIENNKIIAEFMNKKDAQINAKGNGIEWVIQTKNLKYHTDWDWLMEVIEKIENLETNRFDFQINQWNSRIFDHENTEFIVDLNADSKIQAVYNACIEFIKWYNQNKN